MLAQLPRIIIGEAPAAVGLLRAELDGPASGGGDGGAPGQEGVIAALLDVVLVQVLQRWAAQSGPPGWLAAADDPVVGPMLQAVHDDPSVPHSVATLARTASVSRATASARFAALVGVPPMTYLRSWRLALAAELLLDPGLTLDAIARRVGYGGGFALSAAFRREFGHSPQAHRALAAAG